MHQVILQKDLARWQPIMKAEAAHIISEAQIEGYGRFGDFAVLSFDWYDIAGAGNELCRILIYMDSAQLIFICEDESACDYCTNTLDTIVHTLPDAEDEQLLYHFFIQLFRGDMDYLEAIEDTLDATMDVILAGNTAHVLDTIASERRELVRLKRYYEQINVLFDDILLDDAPFFSEKVLDRLAILDARTDRYSGKVQNLQAIVSQMQDTYQAQLSIQQNDLMKVFTIVTAIFLPLTLLVGWYGMNFQDMPELHWRYGYPAVIIVSVVIVLGLFWYFKHKKWL